MIRPVSNKDSSTTKLILRVKDYQDYKSLISKWPLDSFKLGVKAESSHPKLKVIILNVDRKLKIDEKSIFFKKIHEDCGLYSLKRIYNYKNQPCNKLSAKCKSIKDFIYILKNGILIGENEQRHDVLPHIINH
ncbi:unnamed protein product [Brachionus calyciflorus]|uniref:Uncharacterized protein n=1 Tax=Brachionus calyciflorus TaxID=104777 RepID=A0A814N422_9BILA|nr:unnamed protein product [Brachionus calyciflorus]